MDKKIQDFMRESVKLLQAEVEAWRKRHPREVQYVAEEARAKVENRAPNYPPARAYI